MAGSYQHVLHGWSLIENMGDAQEAVEELMWLVQSQIGTKKAKDLLKSRFYPMQRGEIKKDKSFEKVTRLMHDTREM
ncbi:MAG: hypothetical protein PHS80_00140 [Methanothrix sp.]|nr:hypothetical protein [Methanothrix sp.]